MPIRFRCTACNVLLSISSRKAGSSVNCPKCGAAQTVPDSEPAGQAATVAATPAAASATVDLVKTKPAPKPEAAAPKPESEPPKPESPKPELAAEAGPKPLVAAAKRDKPPPRPTKVASAAAATPQAEAQPGAEPEAPAASPPDKRADAAPVAAPESKPGEPSPEPPGDSPVTVYEEVAEPQEAAVADARSAASPPAERRAETATAAAAPSAATKREPLAAELPVTPPPAPEGAPVPGGMILYRRRTLYAHALIFVVLAGLAFGAGYWIGRGDATLTLQQQHEEASRERVLVEGIVTWRPGPAQVVPDEGAVVIAIPEGKTPPQPIPTAGLRPVDPEPGEFNKGVREIKNLGGDYARADAEGKFAIVVPDQGRYRILIISRYAGRKSDPINEEVDFLGIGSYFQLAESLVGRYKYRWTLEEIKPGFNPIQIDFGADDRG